MNCEDCDYADIADWKRDKTGKARPVYWCKRYKEMCPVDRCTISGALVRESETSI